MRFTPDTLKFLRQLKKNNQRDWFEKNRARYESLVREPALEFINAMAPLLKRLSPHFLAVAKKTGGSLMRVYRDTRFSKDKTPYKTNIGIQFRHEFGKDVHAPGYYLHISPEECFLGLGIWHPDSQTLRKIRNHLVENSDDWKKLLRAKAFSTAFELSGDSLKTAPMGFEKDHPLIHDLRRKDFIAVHPLDPSEISKTSFASSVAKQFSKGNRFMRYLCDAIQVPF